MMTARCSTTASKTAENIYAFDHPVGFYQKMQVVANLRRLLGRNHISLQQCSRIIDLGCGDGHAGNRGLGARGIARQVELAGFKLVDRQPCFRNIFGLKRFCTAYLAARLPTDMLLLLERLPFSPANNLFLLFEKA